MSEQTVTRVIRASAIRPGMTVQALGRSGLVGVGDRVTVTRVEHVVSDRHPVSLVEAHHEGGFLTFVTRNPAMPQGQLVALVAS